MDSILLTRLLGEENEKRFKDEVTDILIDRVREDMESYNDYLFDYESMLSEICDKLEKKLKDRIFEEYMERIEKRIPEIVDSLFCASK